MMDTREHTLIGTCFTFTFATPKSTPIVGMWAVTKRFSQNLLMRQLLPTAKFPQLTTCVGQS